MLFFISGKLFFLALPARKCCAVTGAYSSNFLPCIAIVDDIEVQVFESGLGLI
jgi:hypothetical protein